MEIKKNYRITKYCQYEEVEAIGNTDNMELIIQPAYISSSTMICTVKTFINDVTGDGWEVREFKDK